jgi:hypothetical protein
VAVVEDAHKRVVSRRLLPRLIQGLADTKWTSDALQLDDIAPVRIHRRDGLRELGKWNAMLVVPGGSRFRINGRFRVDANPVAGRSDGEEWSYSRKIAHGFDK